jgi:hypothetical protein
VSTGTATEPFEGLRVVATGTVIGAPSALVDGLGLTIDDGSGPLRAVVSADALGGIAVASGDVVTIVGPLGQRDSSGTGTAGYRIHATLPGEFELLVEPTPSPTPSLDPTPTPTATATPTPTPTATPSVSPSVSPSPTPAGSTIADARSQPIGSVVAISGVVTAEPGRLGTPALVAIQDSSGGIVVKVPEGVPPPARGARLELRGPLADPYGQLEIRPAAGAFTTSGTGPLPAPAGVTPASLGESVEGRLVSTTGVVEGRPTKSTSQDITFFLRSSGGSIRIVADASSRLTPDSVVVGATYRIVGVAGQRASRKDAPDGYRIWARDAADLTKLANPAPSGTPGPSDSPGSGGSDSVISIAAAVGRGEGKVSVEGIVTTRPDLLDTSGRRIVIQDSSAGCEILLPVDAKAPVVGSKVRVSGSIGRAYDAPRIRATSVAVLATGSRPAPHDLRHPPTAAYEWRLVRVAGSVAEVHKLGDRWRAEIAIGAERVVISGLAGAKIPPTTLVAGGRATVVGIARRAYPGASDRRWAIVPRSIADIVATSASGGRNDPASSGSPVAGAGASAASGVLDVDLVRLAEHVGEMVRVGGLVTEVGADGFRLDDGTAIGGVTLVGEAADYLPLLEVGDAVNATGRVAPASRVEDGFVVMVEDPAGLARVGDPTGDGLAAVPSPDASTPPASSAGIATRRAGTFLGIGEPGAIGLVGALLVAAASAAVTALRRQRARRLMAARIAVRLARVAGPRAPDPVVRG